jgi:hypothetical protein
MTLSSSHSCVGLTRLSGSQSLIGLKDLSSTPKFHRAEGAVGFLANLPQRGLFRQFGFTFSDSRFLGNLPKTRIDLNRSMSALPCSRQLKSGLVATSDWNLINRRFHVLRKPDVNLLRKVKLFEPLKRRSEEKRRTDSTHTASLQQ